MIRTVGKVVLAVLVLLMIPTLFVTIGPAIAAAAGTVGAIMAIFLPILIIGCIIGYCSKHK